MPFFFFWPKQAEAALLNGGPDVVFYLTQAITRRWRLYAPPSQPPLFICRPFLNPSGSYRCGTGRATCWLSG